MGRCGSGEGGRGHQAGSNGDKLRKPRRTVQHLDVQSGAETSRILLTVSLNWHTNTNKVRRLFVSAFDFVDRHCPVNLEFIFLAR